MKNKFKGVKMLCPECHQDDKVSRDRSYAPPIGLDTYLRKYKCGRCNSEFFVKSGRERGFRRALKENPRLME